ncbi:MAG: cytochrome c oxidase assembly protein [Pseudolabrys sp.]|jgi:cytochrome c oxidase assembly protein subunit 11|nr:cytochrome c oxidase assembly protein [Pseudolabrys sp.]
MTQPPVTKRKLKRDVVVAATCGVVAAGMVGAAFASVPLYNWFCRTTGFGGTTQVAEAAPGQVLDRTLTIRFDSNVAPGLPWRFVPEQNTVQVRIGEVKTVYYKVINMAARDITAQAGYNVTPPQVGLYFHKINCFCFTEQTMKAGETREMAVVFYVDPSIVKDSDQDPLNTITLSYTFFPVDAPQKPVADAETKASKKL